MTHTYAITAKKTRKPITQEHYENYLSYLSDMGDVGNLHYENKKGLHIHFVLKTNKLLNYNKLKPTKYGWNIRAVPVYNPEGWNSYCKKDIYKINARAEAQENPMPSKRILPINCCYQNNKN